MPVFFIDKDVEANANIKISRGEDLFLHLLSVLRVKKGEQLRLFSNRYIYQTEVEEISKDYILLHIQNISALSFPEPHLHIVQAVIQVEKLETTLRLNIPLYVKKFFFFRASKSQFSLNRISIERLKRVAQSVSEQSEVCYLPEIVFLNNLEEVFRESQETFFAVLHPKGGKSVVSYIEDMEKFPLITILIGPEGGFTEKEVKLFEEYNANFITLKSGIFRSEFAGFALSSVLRELL